MKNTKKRCWVVISESAYLVSLPKALRGEGLSGGAYTSIPEQARLYTAAEAKKAASQIYRGTIYRRP